MFAGRVLSLEIEYNPDADVLITYGRPHQSKSNRQVCFEPAGSETSCMQIGTMYGTWDILRLTIIWVWYAAIEARKGKPGNRTMLKPKLKLMVRTEKPLRYKSVMYDFRKSDSLIVPKKPRTTVIRDYHWRRA